MRSFPNIIDEISAEMKRLILAASGPGEEVDLPPTVDDGRAVRFLMNLCWGNAGEAETERAIGLDSGSSLWYYEQVFKRPLPTLAILKRR
jgi:hypothetical protein